MNDKDSTVLSLIDCSLKSLKDVPLRLNLTSLNLHSNQIKQIENLTYLQNLIHLDLSSNQICEIKGLEGLVSLKTLNLSCNHIQSIDGLYGLKMLKWLNLSFNKIQYLNGLNDVSGNDYQLETLLLHGNMICSVDEVKRHLSGLASLRNLTLNDNPIARLNSYRVFIMASLRQLNSLDTIDRSNRKVNLLNNALPGMEQYEEYLRSSVDDEGSDNRINLRKKYPNIDKALRNIENHEFSSSTTSPSAITPRSHRSLSRSSSSQSLNDDDSTRGEMNESNLDKLESQINKLIRVRNLLQDQIKQETENQQISVKQVPQSAQIKSKKQQVSSQIPKFSRCSNQVGKGVVTPKKDCFIQTDDILNQLTKQYEEEKERRKQLEVDLKQANEKIEQLKAEKMAQQMNYEKTSADNYQELYNRERKKADELLTKVTNYQRVICDMKREIDSSKNAQESNLTIIKTLEAAISRLNVEKEESEEKCRLKDANNNLLKQDIDVLKQTINSTQMQIKQLQDLLVSKDTKHKDEMARYVNINGDEVKQLIKCEVDRTQQIHTIETKQLNEKIDTLSKDYKALEDEFRVALVIESNRFADLHSLYERTQRESSQWKQDLHLAKQREERDKALIVELNSLIKEQKSRLQELSKIRQDASDTAKKQNTKLEGSLEECRKYKTQIEVLRKQKEDGDNRIKALESLIDGIRKEKALWSHELAQQGASLAQDRGRLEAQIHTLQSEINTVKKNLEREADNVRIKAKIIEDQTDTIKKLKDAIIERDDTIKKCREEALNTQKNLEKQLADEMSLVQELQEKYTKSMERRDELKLQLAETQEQFEKAQGAYNDLSKKWKDKSELIAELDVKVRQMKENFDGKEKTLIDERNKYLEENRQLQQRVRHIDDDFRKQFDSAQKGHQEALEKQRVEYEKKLQQSQFRVAEVEEEMRILLIETEQSKKQFEEKLKRFNKVFNELQMDLK